MPGLQGAGTRLAVFFLLGWMVVCGCLLFLIYCSISITFIKKRKLIKKDVGARDPDLRFNRHI